MSHQNLRVVIIGSGNVATVLGKSIKNAGHRILQVLSRNENHARELGDVLECESGNYATAVYRDADIYLAAVSDHALYHLGDYTNLEGKIVVHTAGSVPKDVLNPVSKNHGVIYPLQSLNRNLDEVAEIPLLIDGTSADVLAGIGAFAQTFSNDVLVVNDAERLKFHVAAIFVNNFTNHLYALADNFCSRENIDFKKLLPLIEETTRRLKKSTPAKMQTGPAVRQDVATLGKHLKILSADPDLKNIYLKLSESILRLHKVEIA